MRKMKLGAKIALIMVACLIVAVIIAASVCASIAHRVNDKTAPSAELSYWQSYIKDDTLLRNVVMPGSHDAGTAGMPWYSETQDRDIADQLACGARYFDLRVKEKGGECRIYHGPAYSLYLKDILRDVRDFLNTNKTETVILDVHKFGNESARVKTVQMIDEYLANLLLSNDTEESDLQFISNLTLGEARGKCILIWGDEDEYQLSNNAYFLRNNDSGNIANGCLQSFYKSSWNWYYSSEKYIKKAIPAYVDMYKNSVGGLFVLQSQLTDGCLVVGPRYREGQHEKNMNNFVRSLRDSDMLADINIIMRDFLSPEKNCYTIELNLAKGIVKDDCVDSFNAMLSKFISVA